jgi:hypothetical protein
LVLLEEPNNFDALHMLGVICLQRSHLERAEVLVTQALSMRRDTAAEYNLSLIRQCREFSVREGQLCRRVLPRLAKLLLPAKDVETWLRSPCGAAHIVVADPDVAPHLLQQTRNLLSLARQLRVWFAGPESGIVRQDTVFERGRLRAEAVGAHDLAIVVGTKLPVGEWATDTALGLRVLLMTCDAPCQFLDRFRELSGEGRAQVLPCFSDVSLRDCSVLPAPTLGEIAATLVPGDAMAVAGAE